MKQMKFFLVTVMAVVMGVSVTSCMKGDENNTQTVPAIVEVSSYLGTSSMTTLDGYTIQATNTTIDKAFPSNTKMGYIYYSFDPTSETNINYLTSKKIVAELQYAASLDNAVEVTTKGAGNDSIGDTSITSISNILGGSEKFSIKKDKAIMGIDYLMAKKQHYTSLVCYTNEMTSESEDLVLYLRHNKNSDETTYSSYNFYQSGYIPFFIKTFDLSQAISRFKIATDKSPAHIVIKAPVSTSAALTEILTTYSVSYTTN